VKQVLNGKDLNCLINNAGMAMKLKFSDINEKDMMETYRQNVIGPWKTSKVIASTCESFIIGNSLIEFLFFQAFLPLLEKSASQLKQRDIKQSSIINISSIMSSLELSKNLPYYYYDYQCSKVSL
jgi:short-subunit dehydrogenase